MKRKSIIIFSGLILFGCGGSGDSSSSNSSNLDLRGAWISNCYELVDGDDGSFIAYSQDTYTFEEANYTLEAVSFEDVDCITTNGDSDDYFGPYSVGSSLVATDGVSVSRVSLTQDSLVFPDGTALFEIEMVARVTNDMLYFGSFVAGETPEVFYDISYTKQGI